MATNHIELAIPLWDNQFNNLDFSSLESALEAVDTHHRSEYALSWRWTGGAYQDECRIYNWQIADADMTTATTAITIFAGEFTFIHHPTYRSWPVTLDVQL